MKKIIEKHENNTTGVRPVTRIFLQQSFNFDNVSTYCNGY